MNRIQEDDEIPQHGFAAMVSYRFEVVLGDAPNSGEQLECYPRMALAMDRARRAAVVHPDQVVSIVDHLAHMGDPCCWVMATDGSTRIAQCR